VASSGFGSFGLCMWGGEGLQDTVWDSNGWLISCGFRNFEGWHRLFFLLGFSVCIFWASWWRCAVVVLGECCVGGVGVWGLRVGWCSAGWVFGHGVVMWRFFFQPPMFNVGLSLEQCGFLGV
jgi:hypothetical protein